MSQVQTMEERGFLTLKDAADRVGVVKSTVARWCKQNKVVSVNVGTRVYVELDSIVDYLGEDAASELGL